MVAICPCCHQTVAPDTLLVSADANSASRGGLAVKLTPQEARVLCALHEASPSASHRDALICALYGYSDEPEDPMVVLRPIITRLRRKLEPLGVRIDAVINLGYRLDVHRG